MLLDLLRSRNRKINWSSVLVNLARFECELTRQGCKDYFSGGTLAFSRTPRAGERNVFQHRDSHQRLREQLSQQLPAESIVWLEPCNAERNVRIVDSCSRF